MASHLPPGPLERKLQWLLLAPLTVLVASASWLSVAHADPKPEGGRGEVLRIKHVLAGWQHGDGGLDGWRGRSGEAPGLAR